MPVPPDFTDAFDEHVWQIYGFLAYRLGDRADAEDLTQATFERALRSWGRFDPARGRMSTWLLAIAANVLVDHHRAGGRRPDTLAGTPPPDRATAGPEASLGLDPELQAALERLGDREREVIALRFGGDLTGRQIAELTGLSLGNVQQVLSRALRTLREQLGSEVS